MGKRRIHGCHLTWAGKELGLGRMAREEGFSVGGLVSIAYAYVLGRIKGAAR